MTALAQKGLSLKSAVHQKRNEIERQQEKDCAKAIKSHFSCQSPYLRVSIAATQHMIIIGSKMTIGCTAARTDLSIAERPTIVPNMGPPVKQSGADWAFSYPVKNWLAKKQRRDDAQSCLAD